MDTDATPPPGTGTSPVVVAARRTPVGTAGRGLREVDVAGLAAPVLGAVLDDAGAEAGEVGDVVLGNVMGPGGAVARVAALQAGLGHGVPGITLDRQCTSGLDAVALAAARVRAGEARVVLAGGVESASTSSRPYARAAFVPAGGDDPEMGVAAETVAREAGIGRDRQDEYAAGSHARAMAAADAGRLRAELVPVGRLERDERPRRGLDRARLGRLPPAFVPGGTVTAGNSCGIGDGAAVVAIAAESWRRARGLPGLAVRAVQVSGVDPARCGLAIVPAAVGALQRAGLTVADLGAVEVTEAFAGQVLACLDALGVPRDLVCSDGGAIALGHPWGASGAVLVVRLFSRMVRADGPRYGLAACAAGGGQGVAVVVERVT
ncbi:MAG TPA: thiolase family protein [Jiangellales bacterium]|nr:thiolase family protein [Jiangellales bacterium]